MRQWIIFHASTVDTNTASVHDSGTNVDMVALPSDSLIAVAARNGAIEMTFNDTGRINAASGVAGDAEHALESTRVSLDCSNANIPTVIKQIIAVTNRAPHGDGTLLFDELNDVYPSGITNSAITAMVIERTTTAIVLGAA